jgi:hypothetical protein
LVICGQQRRHRTVSSLTFEIKLSLFILVNLIEIASSGFV